MIYNFDPAGILTRGVGAASKALAASTLTSREQEILVVLGTDPSRVLNLENVNYTATPFSHLELIELMDSLSKKGLVHINEYDRSFTPAGRKRALEIQRQMGGANAT